MIDEETALCNTCTDLVSLKKCEAFPFNLLRTKKAGEWIVVCDFCRQIDVPQGDLKAELFATWLPDPLGDEGYAVIIFYDDISKWSLAAHYNRSRLMGLRPGPPDRTLAGRK
jgi:hypothetical protein